MSAERRFSVLDGVFLAGCIGLNVVVWCSVVVLALLSLVPAAMFDVGADGGSAGKEGSGTRPGERAPDFVLSNLDGERARLSDFRGQAVLLNFWASWCPPCQAEMPLLEEYHQRYSPYLVILAVNDDEKADEVTTFVHEMSLTFPVLLDVQEEVARMYGITALPTSFFIDGEGVVQSVWVGMLMREDMDANLLLVGVK